MLVCGERRKERNAQVRLDPVLVLVRSCVDVFVLVVAEDMVME